MKTIYHKEAVIEVVKENIDKMMNGYEGIIDLITNNMEDTPQRDKLQEYNDRVKVAIDSLHAFTNTILMKDSDGTQVTDIAGKVDYPKFKLGKSLSKPMVEDEEPSAVLERLKGEETDAVISYEDALRNEGFSDDIIELLHHIKDEELEHYIELKRAQHNLNKKETEVPTHKNTHIEHKFVVYDCYGEVEQFNSMEAAKKYIEEHKDDDIYTEEYGTDDPGFHIEEEDIEIYNDVIHVKDDLA